MVRKICVVITARPSYSRVKSVLEHLKNSEKVELQLVVAASALLERYGRVLDDMISDGFIPDRKIYMSLEGENLLTSAKSTGLGIIELSSVFDDLKPDIVVTVADRFETISTAIAAAYNNIPLAHIQGGEVTGSIDEKVRHAVTKLSDIHLVSNTDSYERVIRMGEDKDTVFETGCPSIDLVKEVLINFNTNNSKDIFNQGVGDKIDLSRNYLVAMQHPVTNEYLDSFEQIQQTLEAISELNIPTIWFWPNMDAGSDKISKALRLFREKNSKTRIYFLKNLPPEDFLPLLNNSCCLIGNSSVGIRESSFMGVPVVNIGSRQTGRLRGKNVIDVDPDKEAIIEAVNKQLKRGNFDKEFTYGDGNSGEKICKILETVDTKIDKKITY